MKVIANLIKEAVKVDDFTVDLVTPQPDPILPLQLEIFMIMDKEWSEEHGSTKATNISGGDEGNYANLHANGTRSEEHTSELQSLMRISYAVFCLKNKKNKKIIQRPRCKHHKH